MISSRRSFISGAGALLIASPAIVRASSLMPIKSYLTDEELWAEGMALDQEWLRLSMEKALMGMLLYSGPIRADDYGREKVYGCIEQTLIQFQVPLQ